ncbi:hypothetical protein E6P09_00235 [Haloferax mediterranei ATCC 33500]|uniref:Uncharacterized protein n=1 Tax=Haloferax mediterranei (strain ATCC 33500 / DSM 1411 / JCM 8866 / NBRC 14739 / NCIMB 2177 / R-4) TaxID=523841 RepID=I3R6W6_HALMT|nr:hypothetical protein [Haloferax mediterranei]AFK19976.1 hypothetical protein HFX_2289 [Haloferax mediterranei ATCC 33500]AHZ23354.1 hypothetical protein BM92_12220 [Haloferax mediterranei ATCC 33500]ELZ99522.1 hypothetical protein C439_13249 [Haloferax mediterranei ATCC 33500]MDX5987272.1 hypothetical protein [Haloferax mediterranei ATCC 33500]QCQ73794.1 hypothetical protein E6P09_00235 [Haloferax mediterranei ATCC 33500]
MIRALFVLFGLVELLFPDQLVRVLTRIAYEDGSEMTAKSWMTTATRVEGAVFLYLGLRGLCRGSDEDE